MYVELDLYSVQLNDAILNLDIDKIRGPTTTAFVISVHTMVGLLPFMSLSEMLQGSERLPLP